jgi:hypothetical protein
MQCRAGCRYPSATVQLNETNGRQAMEVTSLFDFDAEDRNAPQIWPRFVSGGQSVTIYVRNVRDLAGQSTQIIVDMANSIETSWLATIPVSLDDAGNGSAAFEVPEISTETALWVSAITGESVSYRFPVIAPAVIAASNEERDQVPAAVLERLLSDQQTRYSASLGNAGADGARLYRVVFGIEGVLISKEFKLPGVTIVPLDARPQGLDEEALMTDAIRSSGSLSNVDPVNWKRQFAHARPWVSVIFDEVWATSEMVAESICSEHLETVVLLLALSRGARARPIAVLIDQLLPEGAPPKWRVIGAGYRGNLATGLLAGESQTALTLQAEALSRDPLLRLALGLFADAVAEATPDARYFKFWSVLEVIALSEVVSGSRVTLADGSYWPDGGTTSQAGPRVYELLSPLYRSENAVSELEPANSLFEAVRAWCARRDATAHFGGFVAGDERYLERSWYPFALLTSGDGDLEWQWQRALQSACERLLRSRLGGRS